jgi:iron complex outermembrane recepter protein
MKKLILIIQFVAISLNLSGQETLKGKVLDNETKEPLIGANILIVGTALGTVTDLNGSFSLSHATTIEQLEISYVGYEKQSVIVADNKILTVSLSPLANNLEQVVVTANREAALRSEAPIAISKISPLVINDTKPVLLTEIMNKVPGVLMPNYNNEQHAMAIRQPMTTSAYYLYLEDGVPTRPMGVFNHNALIEMNLFAISNVEVVKGPASSLYGPEAVGGAVNFITLRPTAIPTARVGIQMDQWGYKRMQYGAGGMITKKLGLYVGGFEARQNNSWLTNSDYTKSSINARLDYTLSKKTQLTAALSLNEYNSDMPGNVDSTAYYSREYVSTTDFTYRKVHSVRARVTAQHNWNKNNESSVTLFYRDNYIQQNPNYSIRWKQGDSIATGEINRNAFYSKGIMVQHSKRFDFLNARILAGGLYDNSPTNYWAYSTDLEALLRPDKKSVERYIFVSERKDKSMANYNALLQNAALYTQFEINPTDELKLTLGMRYDRMSFDYENFLNNTSGTKTYQNITPKIGATYELGNNKGIYVNFSRGFSPPGLTAIFRKRPNSDPNAPAEFYYNLEPATFDNYEAGGWVSFFKNSIYLDGAVYQMNGNYELLNIRQEDNSVDYQSAGKTLHRGVEYGITYKPNSEWTIRFGGTNVIHRFEKFTLSNKATDQVKNVDGKTMPQAPGWIANSEVTYKPVYAKGLRLALEWQRISGWYENQLNTRKYDDRTLFGLKGVSYLNFRVGYTWKRIEVFTNIMNLTNELYANTSSVGNGVDDRTTYGAAAPRTFVMGIQYNIFAKR